MSVHQPDSFPETGASADAQEVFRKKYLDCDALISVYADQVLSGNRDYSDRFAVIPAAHHRRAKFTDARGVPHWSDITFDVFDLSHEVRRRVDVLTGQEARA